MVRVCPCWNQSGSHNRAVHASVRGCVWQRLWCVGNREKHLAPLCVDRTCQAEHVSWWGAGSQKGSDHHRSLPRPCATLHPSRGLHQGQRLHPLPAEVVACHMGLAEDHYVCLYGPPPPSVLGYRPQCHGAIMPRGRNATDPICYIRATALGLSVSRSISKQHRSFFSKAIENPFCSGALRTEIKGPSCCSNYRKSLVCCSSNYRKSLVTV